VVEVMNATGNCGFYLRLERLDGTAAGIDAGGLISPRRRTAPNK
jgi:hypothetical protein